jgi:GT2 family glycosyltransferase
MSAQCPPISVLVSNMNGASYLPRLLDSLIAQRGVETEIIVVDRHSSDASLEILARYPAVRVVHEAPESGLVAGYAAGASVATNLLLFFCNEDLYLHEDCLWELASRIDLGKRIAAADPWQWTYDGEQCLHRGTLFRPSIWHIYSPFPFRMHEPNVGLPDGASVAFGCAGATMVHASVYDELGGWDTSFFLDYEDTDFYLRAWQRGWRCATVPTARVYHAVGASNRQLIGRRRQPVSRRRYIAHRSNVIVIALKYFSPALTALGALNWAASLLVNLLLLRLRTMWLDVLVLADVARRLPAVVAFRWRNRHWNSAMPGQRFFLDPRFDLGRSRGS